VQPALSLIGGADFAMLSKVARREEDDIPPKKKSKTQEDSSEWKIW